LELTRFNLLIIAFLFLNTLYSNTNTPLATGKIYGFCVRNLVSDKPAFPQFEAIEEAATISLEWLGNEIETGQMVWAAKDLAEAKRIKVCLEKKGYKVDIRDVVLDDAPHSNVMSARTQSAIAKILNKSMKNIEN
jgi:hypothetical protein